MTESRDFGLGKVNGTWTTYPESEEIKEENTADTLRQRTGQQRIGLC